MLASDPADFTHRARATPHMDLNIYYKLPSATYLWEIQNTQVFPSIYEHKMLMVSWVQKGHLNSSLVLHREESSCMGMCVHEKVSCAATKKSLQSSEGTRCCLLCGHVWIISKIINWYKTYNYILFSLLLQLRLLLLPLERKERETGKRWCMHARTHARTHLKVFTCRANPSRVDVIKRHKKVTNCPPLHASQTHTQTHLNHHKRPAYKTWPPLWSHQTMTRSIPRSRLKVSCPLTHTHLAHCYNHTCGSSIWERLSLTRAIVTPYAIGIHTSPCRSNTAIITRATVACSVQMGLETLKWV